MYFWNSSRSRLLFSRRRDRLINAWLSIPASDRKLTDAMYETSVVALTMTDSAPVNDRRVNPNRSIPGRVRVLKPSTRDLIRPFNSLPPDLRSASRHSHRSQQDRTHQRRLPLASQTEISSCRFARVTPCVSAANTTSVAATCRMPSDLLVEQGPSWAPRSSNAVGFNCCRHQVRFTPRTCYADTHSVSLPSSQLVLRGDEHQSTQEIHQAASPSLPVGSGPARPKVPPQRATRGDCTRSRGEGHEPRAQESTPVNHQHDEPPAS